MLGGVLIGIGWILPIESFYIVIGAGWSLFAPGIALRLRCLPKSLVTLRALIPAEA